VASVEEATAVPAEGTIEEAVAGSMTTVRVESRPLVIFGLCVMLFHLANAALLP
jgi:hypothetical protein